MAWCGAHGLKFMRVAKLQMWRETRCMQCFATRWIWCAWGLEAMRGEMSAFGVELKT